MANHNLPQTTSAYIDFVAEMDARFDDLCYGLDPARSTMTNLPTNAVGWSSAANNWKRWNGTAWVDLATTYAISISGSAATVTQRTINTVSYNGSANIVVEPYVERDDATDAVRYIAFVDSSTAGHQRLNMDVGLTYNPSSSLLGTNITGNAGTATLATSATTATTVTNGVYTVGDQTIAGNKTFSSNIIGSITGNAATVTGGAYLASAQTFTGLKNFTAYIGIGTTVATSPTWTTGTAWLKGISMTPFNSIFWPRTSGGVSKGIATDNSDNLYFITSTADSGAAPVYPFTFAMGTGTLTATGNLVAYSDRALKKDLVEITSALDKVNKLTGYTYTRIDSGEHQTGLIAQDVLEVLPEAVSTSADGTLGIAYGNMIGLLVQAVKELQLEINTIKGTHVW